jgi:hypothetical protein
MPAQDLESRRVVSALAVAALHVAVLWLAWETHIAREAVVQEISGISLFAPGAIRTARTPRDFRQVRHQRALHGLSQRSSNLSPAPVSGLRLSAPSPSPPAPAMVDWQQALESVAGDLLEQAKIDAARAARMSQPQSDAAFEPLHVKPHDFDWVSRHSRLITNAQGVPEWVLVQPCAPIILLTDPDCTVERVEQHGVLFEFMQQQRDATLEYGGTNAIP